MKQLEKHEVSKINRHNTSITNLLKIILNTTVTYRYTKDSYGYRRFVISIQTGKLHRFSTSFDILSGEFSKINISDVISEIERQRDSLLETKSRYEDLASRSEAEHWQLGFIEDAVGEIKQMEEYIQKLSTYELGLDLLATLKPHDEAPTRRKMKI